MTLSGQGPVIVGEALLQTCGPARLPSGDTREIGVPRCFFGALGVDTGTGFELA
jgi:hypothetical protein